MNAKTYEALETMQKRLVQIQKDLEDENTLKDIKKFTELNKEKAS